MWLNIMKVSPITVFNTCTYRSCNVLNKINPFTFILIYNLKYCKLICSFLLYRFGIPSLGTTKECFQTFGSDPITIPTVPAGTIYYAPNNTNQGIIIAYSLC